MYPYYRIQLFSGGKEIDFWIGCDFCVYNTQITFTELELSTQPGILYKPAKQIRITGTTIVTELGKNYKEDK